MKYIVTFICDIDFEVESEDENAAIEMASQLLDIGDRYLKISVTDVEVIEAGD
jgi:hypothetical protein